jgi:hypothetical protein
LPDLISSLKLPNNSLSESLLSFARNFSLSLDEKLLHSLYREVSALKETKTRGTAGRETAAALGAAAAADKGLSLGTELLGKYAAAIDGEGGSHSEENPDPGDNPEGSLPDTQTSADHGAGVDHGASTDTQANHGASADHGDAKHENQKNTLAARIANKVSESLKTNPWLDLINRVPGQDGRRWVVLPFTLNQNGIELKASLRILLKDDIAERFAADITLVRKWGTQRWLFVLEKPGTDEERIEFSAEGKTQGQASAMKREIAEILKLPPGKVFFKQKMPVFKDSTGEILRTIDEKV